MISEEQHRFLFNASGVGFAARVRLPFQEIIQGQAATSLSLDGGYSESRAGHFNFRNLFSFTSAVTIATGSFNADHNAWETLITTRVEKLNILNMITADAVVARLVSTQFLPAPGSHKRTSNRESEYLPLGSYFENLRVAGCLVVTVPGDMSTQRFATFSSTAKIGKGEITRHSIFEPLSAGCKGLNVRGNVIEVPNFGRVTLGELFVMQRERRLTMIRAELGCPVVGDSSVASVHGDGIPFPPYQGND